MSRERLKSNRNYLRNWYAALQFDLWLRMYTFVTKIPISFIRIGCLKFIHRKDRIMYSYPCGFVASETGYGSSIRAKEKSKIHIKNCLICLVQGKSIFGWK